MTDYQVFASLADLENRWHVVDASLTTKAQTALDDASALIIDECNLAGVEVGFISANTLRAITCAMVIRKLTTDDDHLGVTNSSQTAGSFSESFTYTNPMGELYLTSAERKRLGLRRQHAFAFDTSTTATPTITFRPNPEGVA